MDSAGCTTPTSVRATLHIDRASAKLMDKQLPTSPLADANEVTLKPPSSPLKKIGRNLSWSKMDSKLVLTEEKSKKLAREYSQKFSSPTKDRRRPTLVRKKSSSLTDLHNPPKKNRDFRKSTSNRDVYRSSRRLKTRPTQKRTSMDVASPARDKKPTWFQRQISKVALRDSDDVSVSTQSVVSQQPVAEARKSVRSSTKKDIVVDDIHLTGRPRKSSQQRTPGRRRQQSQRITRASDRHLLRSSANHPSSPKGSSPRKKLPTKSPRVVNGQKMSKHVSERMNFSSLVDAIGEYDRILMSEDEKENVLKERCGLPTINL